MKKHAWFTVVFQIPLLFALPLVMGCDSDSPDGKTKRPFYTDIPATQNCLQVVDTTLANADADLLFNYDHVPVFDIFLPPEKWDALLVNARNEEYAEVDACFEGKAIGKIGLRFKGGKSTLFSCFDENNNLICPRLSMKMKFSEYEDDKRFFGLKRLNLQANRWDASMMREKLAYDAYREMGIAAPRASWAMVRVNGKSQGLYGTVEAIDGRFTADRWPSYPDGNLYKEVWPLDYEPTYITDNLKTNEDEGNIDDMLSLSGAMVAAISNPAELQQLVKTHTDLNYWARFLAVGDAIGTCDDATIFYEIKEIPGLNHNHNYYFYADSPEHFSIIPWDLDCSFNVLTDNPAPPPHWTEAQQDCSQYYDYWDGLRIGAPACDPIFAALNSEPTHLQAWRAAAQELLNGPFAIQTMLNTIDRHVKFIGREVNTIETKSAYPVVTFNQDVDYIKSIIPERHNMLARRINTTPPPLPGAHEVP